MDRPPGDPARAALLFDRWIGRVPRVPQTASYWELYAHMLASRRQAGPAREIVAEHYSLKALKNRYLQLLENVASS